MATSSAATLALFLVPGAYVYLTRWDARRAAGRAAYG